MQITIFLIGELVVLIHFSSSRREAMLLFHVRRSAALHLVYVSLCKLLVTFIWLYTNEVSGHSFIENVSSVLARSALK